MGTFVIGRFNASRLLAEELARMGIATRYNDGVVEFDYRLLHLAIVDMASTYVRHYWEHLLQVAPCEPSSCWEGALGYELDILTESGLLPLLSSCDKNYLELQAIARHNRGMAERAVIVDRATRKTITFFG